MPPRLLAHARRWKRRKLSNRLLIEWEGRSVKRINKAFRAARKAAGLGPDVTPRTLRHTAITWQGTACRAAARDLRVLRDRHGDVRAGLRTQPSGLTVQGCERPKQSPTDPQPNTRTIE